MNRSRAPRAARGFTLLEAIVAMTIFSMCALALFGWQGTSLRSLERVEGRAARAEKVRLAMAVVQRVNPMLEPKGERTLGLDKVSWQATPVMPVRNGVTQVGLPSLFDLGLYDLAITIARADGDGPPPVAFHLRVVGYRQARKTGFEE